MRSRVAVVGHPIHPVLVALPIGLFVWAFVADLVYLGSSRSAEWYDIAFWSGIAAIGAALIAALPGFADYLAVAQHSDARPIAIAHMLLNLTVVGLYAIAAVLMLDRNAADGTSLGAVVTLHGVGVGLLGMAGFLGGEMVFRHHLGMIPENSSIEHEEQIRHSAPTRSRRSTLTAVSVSHWSADARSETQRNGRLVI